MNSIVNDTLHVLIDTLPLRDSIIAMHVEATDSAVSSIVKEMIIPLIIFLLGITADAILRNRAKKQSLKSIRSTIVFWYKKERALVEQAIQNVTDMAERISTSEILQPEGVEISDIDLSRLCDFRLDELTNAFVENTQGDEESVKFNYLYHFQKGCRYIEKAMMEIRIKYEQYVTDIRNLMDEWNSAYKQLLIEIDKFPDYTLRTEWQQLYLNCQSQGGGSGDHINYDKWYSIIIEPFMAFCESEVVKFSPFPIMVKLNDLRNVVIKLRGERAYSKLFTDYASSMKKTVESLDKCLDYIGSARIKCWVH